MANPITWQNVSVPDLRGSMDGFRIAGAAFDRAGTGLNEALTRFDVARKEAAASQLLNSSLNFTTPEELRAAQADGRLFAGMNRDLLTPAAVTALDNRARSLLSQATGQQALNTSRELDPLRIQQNRNLIRTQDQEFQNNEVMNPLRQEGQRISNDGGRITNAGGLIRNQIDGVRLTDATDAQGLRRRNQNDVDTAQVTAQSLDSAPNALAAYAMVERDTSLSPGAREALLGRLAQRWGVNYAAARSDPNYAATFESINRAPPTPSRYISATTAEARNVPRGDGADPARERAVLIAALDPNDPDYLTKVQEINNRTVLRAAAQGAPFGTRVQPISPDAAPRPVPAPASTQAQAAPGPAQSLQTPEQITEEARARTANVNAFLQRITRRQEEDSTQGIGTRYADALRDHGDRQTVLAGLRAAGSGNTPAGPFASVDNEVVARALDNIVSQLPTRNYNMAAQILRDYGTADSNRGYIWDGRPIVALNRQAIQNEIQAIRTHERARVAGAVNTRSVTLAEVTAANDEVNRAAQALATARASGSRFTPSVEEQYNQAVRNLQRIGERANTIGNQPQIRPDPPRAQAAAQNPRTSEEARAQGLIARAAARAGRDPNAPPIPNEEPGPAPAAPASAQAPATNRSAREVLRSAATAPVPQSVRVEEARVIPGESQYERMQRIARARQAAGLPIYRPESGPLAQVE